MNLRDYDLNLLTIFDVIIESGSVSGAAERLDMTTGAVSRAITRMREKSRDPLFVRDGRGIRPTNYAFTMHQHIKEGLVAIERGLDTETEFNGRTSSRKFVLAGESYLDNLLFPALLIHLKKMNAKVSVELLPAEDSINSVSSVLSERKADIFLSTETIEQRSVQQHQLKTFDLVTVCSGKHPRIQGTLSQHQFFSEEHAALQTKRLNERFLSRLTEQTLPPRKVVYQSQSPLNMIITAASTELLTLVFRWMAEQWQEKLNLQVFDLPFATHSAPLYMSWHTSKENDPGIQWLKEQLLEVIRQGVLLPGCNH